MPSFGILGGGLPTLGTPITTPPPAKAPMKVVPVHHSQGGKVSHPIMRVHNYSNNTPAGQGFTPDQIRQGYGINSITFDGGTIVGDGTGQTIAIVDAYNDAEIYSDLDGFSQGVYLSAADVGSGTTLYNKYGAASSFLTVYDQNGNVIDPATQTAIDDAGVNGWESEISLDVEWAHAIAPGAKIYLIEANSSDSSDMYTAVLSGAAQSTVSVVSMSWGADEYSTETSDDSIFTKPSGHQGVAYVAATGDLGAPGGYPAYSPNVLAVGGTDLALDAGNNWQSELGWDGSGGGTSLYETEPSYQNPVQSTGSRTIPDVAFNAAQGVVIYDAYDYGAATPWSGVDGTSFSAPSWAALIAIADQGRVADGGKTLNTASDTQANSYVYDLPSSDFHDITTDDSINGNGGFFSGVGYDEVTGLGTPKADKLIPDLADLHLPKISPASMPQGEVGVAYSLTLNATEGIGNKTMTISGLPAGLSGTIITNGVVVSGTPTASGTFVVTVTATDTIGQVTTVKYSLKINPAITISPASLPNGFINVAYGPQNVTASGGDSSAAITGLNIVSSVTGVNVAIVGDHVRVNGTPTDGGTVAFTVTATDNINTTGVTKSYSFVIDKPATLAFSQQPVDTKSGSVIAPAPVVDITGITGNLYGSSVTVSLSVISGPGTFDPSSTTSVTTSSGQATFSNLKFITTGTYQIRASLTFMRNGSPVTITVDSVLFNITASKLKITAAPPATVGSTSPFNMTVTAQDAAGNTATNFNGPITIAINTFSPASGAVLGTAGISGTTVLNATSGVATFTSLNLNKLGDYTLKATSGSLTSATTGTVTVKAGQLVFTTLPATATVNTAFTTTVVKAEDVFGNVDSSFGSTVTLSVNTGPGSITSGSTAVAASGVANFNAPGITIDKSGNYILKASASPAYGTITGLSGTLLVEPQSIKFTATPAAVKSGNSFPVQVTAYEDAAGTVPATGFNGQAVLSVNTGPAGGTIGGSIVANFVNGVATFPSVSLNRAGTYTLKATVLGAGGPTAISVNIQVTASDFNFVSPSQPPVGSPFNLVVNAVDVTGNNDTAFGPPVTLTVISTPLFGTISGIVVPTIVNGTISFGGLILSAPGDYVVQVTGGGITRQFTLSTASRTNPPLFAFIPPAVAGRGFN